MKISKIILDLGCLAAALALSLPCAAVEQPPREWTQQMCEETATSMSNPRGDHHLTGCYGLVAKRMDIFEACYAYPIDFSKGCSYGETPPLAIAVKNRDIATIDRLILKGADVQGNLGTLWGTRSILVIAAAACRDYETMPADCAATVHRLIELGADVNGPPGMDTPLIMASMAGSNLELVKTLLDAGAEINRKGQDGHTAWDHARMPSGRKKTADYLRSRGATGDPLLEIKQKLFELMWPSGQH